MSNLTKLAKLTARLIAGLIAALTIPQAISRGSGQTVVVALVAVVIILLKPHQSGTIRGILTQRLSFPRSLGKRRRNR
jgi:hypothetical protein